jgi:AraC family transcriptional regulator, regulatory protein of adaptative response / DNA-3-methyladenine glycosylase II
MLRRKSAVGGRNRDLVLRLSYRPPYDWENVLAFFAARAIPGVEVVEAGRYFRVIEVAGSLGSIAVSHRSEDRSLEVAILFPSLRALPAIVDKVRRLFDLGADVQTINRHLSADRALARLVKQRPGLRSPGGWDGFEVAVRAVLGQQISVAAARRLAGQLVLRHGRPLPLAYRIHSSLSRGFPTASRLALAPVIGLAMPAARLETLRAVAEATVSNPNLFQPFGKIDETVSHLRSIRGIGEWTAHYIALRALRESDAFPAGDLGILRGAASIAGENLTRNRLVDRAESWRPWRAYAAQHLWAAGASARQNSGSLKDPR